MYENHSEPSKEVGKDKKYFMHSHACEILHRILLKPLPEKDFEVGSD